MYFICFSVFLFTSIIIISIKHYFFDDLFLWQLRNTGNYSGFFWGAILEKDMEDWKMLQRSKRKNMKLYKKCFPSEQSTRYRPWETARVRGK